jgi:hypothetical protein
MSYIKSKKLTDYLQLFPFFNFFIIILFFIINGCTNNDYPPLYQTPKRPQWIEKSDVELWKNRQKALKKQSKSELETPKETLN